SRSHGGKVRRRQRRQEPERNSGRATSAPSHPTNGERTRTSPCNGEDERGRTGKRDAHGL
ncbi:hypothetical protein ACQP3L_28530, partial [Escherichia coli]